MRIHVSVREGMFAEIETGSRWSREDSLSRNRHETRRQISAISCFPDSKAAGNILPPDALLIIPVGRAHYMVPPIGLGYLATSLLSDSLEICVIPFRFQTSDSWVSWKSPSLRAKQGRWTFVQERPGRPLEFERTRGAPLLISVENSKIEETFVVGKILPSLCKRL
jgi:hypothetical protein